jgi:hypothetical protein
VDPGPRGPGTETQLREMELGLDRSEGSGYGPGSEYVRASGMGWMGVCWVSGRRASLSARREDCWFPSGIFDERRMLTMKGAYATRFCYGYLRPSAPEELFFFSTENM